MSQTTPSLYTIPGASKGDLSKTFFVAFWIWFCLALISMITATQYAAHQFNYSPALGDPLIGNANKPGGLYAPTDVFVWIVKYWRPDVSAAVRDVLTQAIMILLAGSAGGLITALAFVLHRTRRVASGANHLHGSAGWASVDDITGTGLLPSEKKPWRRDVGRC